MELIKNLPEPKHFNTKYDFAGMKKGNAFELTDQTPEGVQRVRNAANLWRTRNKPDWGFSVKLYEGKYFCKRIK